MPFFKTLLFFALSCRQSLTAEAELQMIQEEEGENLSILIDISKNLNTFPPPLQQIHGCPTVFATTCVSQIMGFFEFIKMLTTGIQKKRETKNHYICFIMEPLI